MAHNILNNILTVTYLFIAGFTVDCSYLFCYEHLLLITLGSKKYKFSQLEKQICHLYRSDVPKSKYGMQITPACLLEPVLQ